MNELTVQHTMRLHTTPGNRAGGLRRRGHVPHPGHALPAAQGARAAVIIDQELLFAGAYGIAGEASHPALAGR